MFKYMKKNIKFTEKIKSLDSVIRDQILYIYFN